MLKVLYLNNLSADCSINSLTNPLKSKIWQSSSIDYLERVVLFELAGAIAVQQERFLLPPAAV